MQGVKYLRRRPELLVIDSVEFSNQSLTSRQDPTWEQPRRDWSEPGPTWSWRPLIEPEGGAAPSTGRLGPTGDWLLLLRGPDTSYKLQRTVPLPP
ncbi:Hypothetical predicted protein [Pelobates cultripes]|uniref:Uncharacterized protein n=1 Tax=Pelobates cultripes TaxID=61616 RepID=A0AAD1S5S1_PELCU|nr:Hypothetical predicted protein [Pelobates cultripes]